MRLRVICDNLRMAAITLVVSLPCRVLLGQTSNLEHMQSQRLPSYEVATIKPSKDGTGFPLPLRIYILSAFGMNSNSSSQLIGPSWINNTSYEIHGKPPDSLRDAMDKMTPEEKNAETQLMMQSLLADRFKMKYHLETRETGVYRLVLAKSGSKLKEDSDRTKARAIVGSGRIKATAMTIPALISLLSNDPELEGRPLIDKTGLAGDYDFSLTWSPLEAVGGVNSVAASSMGDAPSLFTALEEQLGLKLVASKTTAKVVVIDHIEQPSPN